ncbi:MAG: site-specific integrase [Gloeocapsa sp. UFS-A4-WI-NPMV-4B04]|nr:site-specific integrase [Gloeocapsa sp. UFS-A4-WI-NPMV-4B04]
MPALDFKHADCDLKLRAPLPSTRHPATVYLASLNLGSRPTMHHALDAIASLLTNGECDALTLDWSLLRYQHTAAVRSALISRYTPSTTKKMLCALRRVLQEARKLRLISLEDYTNAIDLPRIDTPPQKLRGRALSESELAALVDVCQTEDSRPIDIRDLALIAILRGGGVRRTEAVNLELRDFNPKTGALEIRSGKRKSYRTVYLPSAAIELVSKWLLIRGHSPGALLCPVKKGAQVELRSMTADAVLKIVRRRSKQASVEEFSPHDFRRTFCSDLLDAGTDIVTVQKLAGHASPVTTAKYDRRGEEVKRKAVERLSFPSSKNRTTE